MNGVLLAQQDVHCLDLPTPIRYPPRAVSHFRYWRDNLLLLRVHAWLLRGIFIWPRLFLRRLAGAPPFDAVLHRG